jgi:hypothetical protein
MLFEDNKIEQTIYEGHRGYWLKTDDYAELLGISKSVITANHREAQVEEYIEGVFLNIQSPRLWRFFITTEREPYSSERALAFRNTFLLEELSENKASKSDMVKWKEIKNVSVLLKENPNASTLISRLSKETPESIDALFELSKKFHDLFDATSLGQEE